jgi:hypothetical protein
VSSDYAPLHCEILRIISLGGPPGLLSGSVTGALICALLQFGHNELRIARLNFVSRQLQEPLSAHPLIDAETSMVPRVNNSSAPTTSVQRRSFWEATLDAFGKTGMFHRISNEEYLSRLKTERQNALQRIAELEAQICVDDGNSRTP